MGVGGEGACSRVAPDDWHDAEAAARQEGLPGLQHLLHPERPLLHALQVHQVAAPLPLQLLLGWRERAWRGAAQRQRSMAAVVRAESAGHGWGQRWRAWCMYVRGAVQCRLPLFPLPPMCFCDRRVWSVDVAKHVKSARMSAHAKDGILAVSSSSQQRRPGRAKEGEGRAAMDGSRAIMQPFRMQRVQAAGAERGGRGAAGSAVAGGCWQC